MFAWDQRRSKCVNFAYSGCGGTENLFFKVEECKKTCSILA